MSSSAENDLAALALMLRGGLEDLGPILQAHPGFDWSAFAQAGWRRWKYDDRHQGEGPLSHFAVWAAAEGDSTAFDYLAERAASGSEWHAKPLAGVIEGEHPDIVAHVRDFLGKFRFEPVTRRWKP